MVRSSYESWNYRSMFYPLLDETERSSAVVRELSSNHALLKEDAASSLEYVVENWNESQLAESRIAPRTARTPDTAESRTRGRELYLSAKAKCYFCHGESGRGDGELMRHVQQGRNGRPNPEPGLYDDWGQRSPPPDLTSPTFQYRGGSRDIDLFQRIMCGIKGTAHVSYGVVLTEEEVWDIINYVDSLRSKPTTEPKPN
jgi:mono/diheme cytochrome c family protein